ncbi:uncharacterized protein LOC108466169 [Gossypium arboreum]|uniref:Uncharacterized protein n=1 Tax=Gossypium arboreum TaxID=29729 RepID=A0ABR0QUT5_GOSAR|nr:uncharacterized protein LOC108466169 [Gossypium arboreum]KAK5843090.1 hypothetical protein PVK06_005521 [Gossypium arboreum]
MIIAMMYRPKKLKQFYIIPALFLILSTLFSVSHGRKNENVDLQSDGIMRLVKRKMEETESRNSSIILAKEETERPDPLNKFKDYKGGWDITSKHYLASVGYSSAPFALMAIVWFMLFGIFLLCACICCCCCHRNKPYGYSRLAYACSLIFLILFTIATVAGCALMFTGEGKFLASVNDVSHYIVNQGLSIYDNIIGIQNFLISAKNVVLNNKFVPDDLKGEVDKANKLIDSVGSLPRIKSQDITDEIRKLLKQINTALITITVFMLLLAFLGFLFSILGMKTCVYMFVVIGWIVITLTFFLCGLFLVFHNIVSDTCIAMDEWIQDPMAESAMGEVLPCFDMAFGKEIKEAGKGVTTNVNDLLNQFITVLANNNTANNQSGPFVPLICDPYKHGDSQESCGDEVPLKNATEEWKKYVCQVSEDGDCTTPGRLTPDMYTEMIKAVNISNGLYDYNPFIAGVADCSIIQDTLKNITTNHCPGLKKYSEWVYSGLVAATGSVMFSLFFWVLYARERRHRKYTKRINKGYDESPLVGGKKL